MIQRKKIIILILVIIFCFNSFTVNTWALEGRERYKDFYQFDIMMEYYNSNLPFRVYYFEDIPNRVNINFYGDWKVERNEWQKYLDVIITPYKHMYYLDEDNKPIIQECYDPKSPFEPEAYE